MDFPWPCWCYIPELHPWHSGFSVQGRVLANYVAMPIQGVVEDTFSIGSPVDMEKYFDFYEKQILDVENLEQTNSPWCVAHAALRDDTHCKTLVLSIFLNDVVCIWLVWFQNDVTVPSCLAARVIDHWRWCIWDKFFLSCDPLCPQKTDIICLAFCWNKNQLSPGRSLQRIY